MAFKHIFTQQHCALIQLNAYVNACKTWRRAAPLSLATACLVAEALAQIRRLSTMQKAAVVLAFITAGSVLSMLALQRASSDRLPGARYTARNHSRALSILHHDNVDQSRRTSETGQTHEAAGLAGTVGTMLTMLFQSHPAHIKTSTHKISLPQSGNNFLVLTTDIKLCRRVQTHGIRSCVMASQALCRATQCRRKASLMPTKRKC